MKTLLASLATSAVLAFQPLAATAESINLDSIERNNNNEIVNMEDVSNGVDYGYYDVYLENLTYETIYVGIHYLRWDGVWVTKGWYEVKPWQKIYVLGYGDTKNRYIYFTAETADEEWEWEGSATTKYVRGEKEKFFKVNMGTYVKQWVQQFSY